jgi:hypothetical protein
VGKYKDEVNESPCETGLRPQAGTAVPRYKKVCHWTHPCLVVPGH